jgi:predicted AAA+ superfamily ATPase
MEGVYAQLEIATSADTVAKQFSRELIAAIEAARAHSALYRGKVLSFETGIDTSGMRSPLRVHRLSPVVREAVILNAATMNRLDRHTFEFDCHRSALKLLGQSTRKGVLLYGPPGTGKTHIIHYIASNLPHRTTVLVTAEQVGLLSKYMMLARTLQPSVVVLEDVDLVGRSRDDMNSPKTEVLLNRLLNEMDGLQDDSDVLFILTTNRPEDIEEALASRPGRVDEAIEIPNPDAECRSRLLALYGSAIAFDDGAAAEFVKRSEGVSAAFIKEMVRRLAQVVIAGGHSTVRCSDVVSVLGDAIEANSRIGRRIVGLSVSARRLGGERTVAHDACC